MYDNRMLVQPIHMGMTLWSPWEPKFVHYISGQKILAKLLKWQAYSVCGSWLNSNMITFPMVKKSSSWRNPLSQKRKLFSTMYVHVHLHRIAWNKYYGVITKRMNFNCPFIETSESIESNEKMKLNVHVKINVEDFTPFWWHSGTQNA